MADRFVWLRGSQWVQAQPAGSSWQSALPTHNPQGSLRIRRNQPLQFMAADFVCYPAAASGCRLSLPGI